MRMGEGGTIDFERKETCLMLMADNGVGRVLVLPRNWGMAFFGKKFESKRIFKIQSSLAILRGLVLGPLTDTKIHGCSVSYMK